MRHAILSNRAHGGLRLGLALLLAVASGACVEFEQLIKVNKDGSGELIRSVRISESFVETMSQEGPEPSAAEVEEGLAQMEEAFKSDPGTLGAGVRFVDVETIPAAEGSKLPLAGFVFRYEFDDISSLDFSALPDMGQAGGMAGGEGETSDEDRLAFRFSSKGKKSTVSAVFFESEEQMRAEFEDLDMSEAVESGTDEMADAMLEMMKEMLAGFRIKVAMEVAGKVTSTNAAVIDGNTVTLIEVDFDRLFEQEDKLAGLQGLEGEPSLAQLGLVLQDVDGLTFPMTPEVSVEFK